MRLHRRPAARAAGAHRACGGGAPRRAGGLRPPLPRDGGAIIPTGGPRLPEGRRDCGTGRRSSYSSSYAASESSASSLASSSARPRGKSSSLSSSSYPSSNVLRLVRALDCGGGPPLLRPPLPPLLRPPPPPLDRRGAPRLGLLAASAKGEDPPLNDDTKSRARTEVAIVILIVSYFSHKMCRLLTSGPRGEDTGYIYHESTTGTAQQRGGRQIDRMMPRLMVPIGDAVGTATSSKFVRVRCAVQMVFRIRSTDSTTVDGQTLRCSLTVAVQIEATTRRSNWAKSKVASCKEVDSTVLVL